MQEQANTLLILEALSVLNNSKLTTYEILELSRILSLQIERKTITELEATLAEAKSRDESLDVAPPTSSLPRM